MRALIMNTATRIGSATSVITPRGQCSTSNAATNTSGVTTPLRMGVNKWAGSSDSSNMPCVSTWLSRAVFCGVNQPTGRRAM